MELYILTIIALIAGIVQGVTGFGAGIVMMMVLPMFYALPQSAGISGAISIILCATMVYTYREHIDLKKIVGPSFLYLIVCSIVIHFSTTIDQVLMKKVFGIFLVILCVYYLFINKSDEKKELNLFISLFCIVVSAICDGLFGIGGPLMVLYFLAKTHHTYEYLGTIQTFFMINCIYNTGFRIFKGIITFDHLIIIGCGIIGILIGGMIAKKLVDRLDGTLLKKLTYVMIGISGIINLF